MALACITGIFFSDLLNLPLWIWATGAGITFITLILAKVLPKSLALTHILRQWTRINHRLPRAVLVLIFFLAGWLQSASQPNITPEHVAFYNNRGTVQVVGTVVRPPDPRDSYTNLTVQVESLRTLDATSTQAKSQQITGLVLVQALPGGEWAYGDRLQIMGELQTPYEGADFSYRDYLARKGILSLMPYARVERISSGQGNPIRAFIYGLRAQGFEALQTLFRSPESDLLAGILLGRDQGLSPELQEAFRRTGTTHIIAISGFNIAILAGLFAGVFTRLLGRRWGAVTAIIGITGYTILVGADAAVIRAAIMGALGVFGGMFGRRQNGLNSLGMAALGMMLANPNIPWDVGFQLSVAATLGLVLYAQPLEERFLELLTRWMPEERAQKWIGPFSEFFLFTIAAQLMTLPIMAYHFEGISWMAFIANPLILPVQSLVMILGGLAMLAGMVLPGLGQLVAIVVLPFVSYTIQMVTWLARLPGGELTFPDFHALWLVVLYALIFIVTLLPREQRRSLFQKALSPQLGALVLAGLVFIIWSRVLSAPDGNLHLTLLDSEGTVLVQSPAGKTVLIGGGQRPSRLNQYLGQMLPAGDRTLDAVVVGSAYRDDLNALTGSLAKYPPDSALWGVDPEVNQTTATVYTMLEESQIAIITLETGQTLSLGDEVELRVLWTGERGAVLWLKWEHFTALLPTGKVEDYWLAAPEPPDVILLPDGLKAESLPLPTVNLWAPSVILLPMAESDLPLHGDHELVTQLDGYPLVSSLDHGWVRVSTDGERLWVNSEW